MNEADTGWIVHVRLWSVKVGVSAEQLWDQRQHQRGMTGAQELETPEQRERRTARWRKTERKSGLITSLKPNTPDGDTDCHNPTIKVLFNVFISF